MTYYILHTNGRDAIASDRTVIKQDEITTLQEASALNAELRAKLDAASDALEISRVNGYAAGVHQGAADARKALESSFRVHIEEMQRKLEAAQATYQQDVVQLSCNILRRIAGEPLPQDVFAGMVQQALKRMPTECELTLHLNPAMAESLEGSDPFNELISISPDSSLAPLDCWISSKYGDVDCGFETQLARIETALLEKGGQIQ